MKKLYKTTRNPHQPFKIKMPIISFKKGSRHYTIRMSIDGKNIKYGATIYNFAFDTPHNKISDEDRIRHIMTATKRIKGYPVETIWNGYPEHIKTRRQKQDYLNSSKFRSEIITILCKNGVRHRPSGTPPETVSIREKQYIHSMNKTTKLHNRTIDKYEQDKIRDKEQVSYDIRARLLTSNVERLDESIPFFECVFGEKTSDRIFHVIYRRSVDGQIEYGACVFNPTTEEDWINYDEGRHLDTAWERFERFPVKGINLNVKTHQYGTRQATSGKISIYNNKGSSLRSLRKCIGKYGVRSRGRMDVGSDECVSTMFLKKAEKWTKCMSQTKKLRREYQKEEEKYIAWKERSSVSNRRLFSHN
jgi:hypothetical protein